MFIKLTPALSVSSVSNGGTGEIAYRFINLDQAVPLVGSPVVRLTGYHCSFDDGNLVDQIGLGGHLPVWIGAGSFGTGSGGASILTEIPIGFSLKDFGDTISPVVNVVSILTARTIGFLIAIGPTSIFSNSARIV